MDMSTTIAPKSDQINADDLIGGPRTITITRVSGNEGSAEQPVNIFFEGDGGKPFRPCKSMRRVMVAAWGADAATYVGRSMTLYRDPSVQFGGMQVGGIRISHMSHIDRDLTMALTATRAKRAPFTVKRLAERKPAPPVAQPASDVNAALDAARAAARRGTDEFRAWWSGNPTLREAVRPALAELQKIAAATDADPFGLPPLDDPAPTPDEIAAATDAAARAARDAAAEYEDTPDA